MERDFTAKCYNKFCALLEPLNDKNWRGLSDWLGGNTSLLHQPSLSESLPNWGDILSKTTEMEASYRGLLDRHHASKEKIRDVFENISALDSSFSHDTPGHFGSCRKQLDVFRQYIKDLSYTAFAGTTPPAVFGGVSNCFSPTSVNIIMEKSLFRLQLHNLSTLQSPQFTASTFYTLSSEEKAAYVAQCNELCPSWAENFSKIFSDPDWTEQEKLDIKFLIYNAPEPYRSIYLKYLNSYNITVFQYESADSDGNTDSCYYASSKKVFLLDGDYTFRYNERGPYNTFFHECGHALDDSVHETDGWDSCDNYLSANYEVNGQNLQNCIVEDTRTYIIDYINSADDYKHLTKQQKDALLISLNLSDRSYFRYEGYTYELPKPLESYRDDIKQVMASDLSGQTNEAASDIYGGVTNNAITGDYGHWDDDYWYSIWYNADGSFSHTTPTKNQAIELWAEFFAAQMTHDEAALASIKAHFPTAYPLLEEMARDMLPT